MRPARSCSRPPRLRVESVADIVARFLSVNAPEEDRYLAFYRPPYQRSLEAAITASALARLPGGKRFSHQWRIPGATLESLRVAMLQLDYGDLRAFADLYDRVAKAVHHIPGIGPLTLYDTVHRLGAYLKLSPEHVYLHAGALEGARLLGLNVRSFRVPPTEFPKPFLRLRPEQIEDCLCIYKSEINRLSQRTASERPKQAVPGTVPALARPRPSSPSTSSH